MHWTNYCDFGHSLCQIHAFGKTRRLEHALCLALPRSDCACVRARVCAQTVLPGNTIRPQSEKRDRRRPSSARDGEYNLPFPPQTLNSCVQLIRSGMQNIWVRNLTIVSSSSSVFCRVNVAKGCDKAQRRERCIALYATL